MMTTLMVLGLGLSAPQDTKKEEKKETVYERLKRRNLFAPKLKKRRTKDPTRKPIGPTPEKKPTTFPFAVAGIVFNTETQAYEVLLYDEEYDEAEYMKPGDSMHECTVGVVEQDFVSISVKGKEKKYEVGDTFKMLVKNRKSGRARSSSSRSSSSSSERRRPRSGRGETTRGRDPDRPAKKDEEIKGGLLDRFRKLKDKEDN